MFDSIKALLENVATGIGDLAFPLGAIAMIICGITWLFSSDPQTVSKAKSWLIRIAVGMIVIGIGIAAITGGGILKEIFDAVGSGK